jgi:PqqD family protein of HPr-rel-A system
VAAELSKSARFRLRKEAVAWQNMAPESVLVQLEREEVHVANPSAVTIIETLQKAASTIEELTARVTDAFEVDPAQATTDVEAFLAAAVEAGIIEEERR